MVVFGGSTEILLDNDPDRPYSRNFPSPVAIYIYRCSLWIDIDNSLSDVKIEGVPPVVSVGSAATATDENEIYILSGFSGKIDALLKKLVLPTDFCQLLTNECLSSPGCGNAVVVETNNKNTTFCYSNVNDKPAPPCNKDSTAGSLHYTQGVSCLGAEYMETRECSAMKTCGECLSDYPTPIGSKIGAGASNCKWCYGCKKVITFNFLIVNLLSRFKVNIYFYNN